MSDYENYPEWIRTLVISGPVEGVWFDSWKKPVLERVRDFVEDKSRVTILLTEDLTCFQILPDLKKLKDEGKDITIKLVTMENHNYLYHIVPFEYRDILMEFKGDKFLVLVEALMNLEGFTYLKDLVKLKDEVDEVTYVKDLVWNANLGINMRTNKVFDYVQENSTELIQIRFYGDSEENPVSWGMSRMSGICVSLEPKASGREEYLVTFRV